jgi:hypothetical protein
MPIGEHSPLGPGFDRRLRAALDRVVPPTPHVMSARYRMLGAPARRALRLVPTLTVVVVVGVVSITAFAATGSANPVVWTQRAAASIQSVSHIPAVSPEIPETSPAAKHSPTSGQPAGGTAKSTPSHSPDSQQSHGEPSDHPEGSPHPEPSDHPWPSPSPEPGDHHPSPSPWPSPWPTPSLGHDH